MINESKFEICCYLCNSRHAFTINAVIDGETVNVCEESYRKYLNKIANMGKPMKKNLLEVTHITNDGVYHDLIMDLDVVKITSIGSYPLEKCNVIYWYIPGIDEENATKVNDSYESLKERIFGVKE